MTQKETFIRILVGLAGTSILVIAVINHSGFWNWLALLLLGYASFTYILKILFPNSKFAQKSKNTSNAATNQTFDEIYHDNGIFEYLEDRFIIHLENETQEIKWDDIQTIFGYKLDLYATDCICAEVFCTHSTFSVTEQTAGWFQFMIHLKKQFPQIDKTWDVTIATPAFDTNLTLVYDRKNRTSAEALKNLFGF